VDAALVVVVVVSKPACVLQSPSSAAEEGENMPLEWSEFDDKDGDTRVGVDIGGIFANSDDEELFFIVVVVCAFTPNPEILVCGTSLGKGEEPFTLDELRKLAGDDDFPYDSDILFCKDEDIVVGFGDDENAAAKPVVAAELIFFSLSLKSFYPFFCCTLQENLRRLPLVHSFKRRDLNEETSRVFFVRIETLTKAVQQIPPRSLLW
jgi:hypothetical protein